MTDWAFSCEPGWEGRLVGELGRVFPHARYTPIAAGWVAGEMPPGEPVGVPSVALSMQCIPVATAVEAKSIAVWVEAAGEQLIAGLANHNGPWRLHVWGVYRPGGPIGPRRAALIADGIRELLRKKQRRLLRTISAADAPWADGEAIIQIGLVDALHGYFSLCGADQRQRLRRIVSQSPGGIVDVASDQQAPSRASVKLREAEIRMGREIEAGQSCVDLGSSPGSWAYLALQRGARVVAVDRSPLRADLMANPRLTFVRGDAFRYQPPEPVDWLLCDVIAAPERIIELIERWIERRWCRWFCVTVKFQGSDQYGELEPLKAWLDSAGAEFIMRRLTSNKNEVTVMGEMGP